MVIGPVRLSAELARRGPLRPANVTTDPATPRPAAKAPGHWPQLDSLRALAVTSVLLSHTWPGFSLGPEGVWLFFVLSGFLITNILLEGRDRLSDPVVQRSAVLGRFYVRRALRIFPAYYLVLAILAIFEWQVTHGSLLFHVTYTSNAWFAKNNSWYPGMTAPFWSLSIEEQFYLAWPLLVLWLPPRRLWIAVALLIVSGPLSRWGLYALGAGEIPRAVLTPVAFDTLGCGALLALARRSAIGGRNLQKFGFIAALVFISFSLGLRIGPLSRLGWPSYVVAQSFWALGSAGLVSTAVTGFRGLLGAALEFKPLRYIGQISYGVYLLHAPVSHFLGKGLATIGAEMPPAGIWRFLAVASVTVAAASLSWHFFEAPLNRFKRFFP